MARTTSVTLSAHFDEFVHKQVASGRYETTSEVIRDSLRLMENQEARLSVLRRELDVGIDELARGDAIDWHTLKADLDAS